LIRAAAPEVVAGQLTGLQAWRRLLPHVVAASDPARRLDPVTDDVRRLLAQAGAYLDARGRSASARALLDDARKPDPRTP
jgi:hypothetical protein